MTLRKKVFLTIILLVCLAAAYLLWSFRYELFYSPEERAVIAEEKYSLAVSELDSEPRAALKKFKLSYRLNPENYNYGWQLALTQKKMGQVSDAAETFERITSRVQEIPLLYVHKAETYEELGATSLAIQSYSDAVETQKASPTTYIRLANLLRSQNRQDEAKKIIADGLLLHPESEELSNYKKNWE